jgi:hypothetical protein
MSPGVCRYQAIDFVHDFAGDLKMQRMRMFSGWAVGMVVLGAAAAAPATPAFVTHGPGDPVFNVPGATQRDPLQPRESETIRAYFKTGPSFSYTSVAVYYTTDGSEPVGSKGIPNPGTLVLLSFGPDIKVNFPVQRTAGRRHRRLVGGGLSAVGLGLCHPDPLQDRRVGRQCGRFA